MSLIEFFMMLVGLLLLSAGVSNFIQRFKLSNPNNVLKGTVQKSTLKELHDNQGRLIQRYYQLNVLYNKDNKNKTEGLRVTTQFDVGENLALGYENGHIQNFQRPDTSLWSGILLGLAGVGVAACPLFNTYLGFKYASYCVCFILACVGFSLLSAYLDDKKSNLQMYEAEIVDTLLFQTGKENSRFKRNTWYPLYLLKMGEGRYHLGHYGASTKSEYKVGKKKKLYWDPNFSCVVEKRSDAVRLTMAAALLLIAVVGLVLTLIGG